MAYLFAVPAKSGIPPNGCWEEEAVIRRPAAVLRGAVFCFYGGKPIDTDGDIWYHIFKETEVPNIKEDNERIAKWNLRKYLKI